MAWSPDKGFITDRLFVKRSPSLIPVLATTATSAQRQRRPPRASYQCWLDVEAVKNLGTERVKKFLQTTSATNFIERPSFEAVKNLGTERFKKFLQTTLAANFIKPPACEVAI